MRRFIIGAIAMVIMLFLMIRDARAGCIPVYEDIRIGVMSEGAWAYWWCASGGKLTYEYRTIATSDITVEIVDGLKAYAAGKNPNLASMPAGTASGPAYTALAEAVKAAVVNDPNRPVVSAWAVSKNGTSPTRPAFPVVNGKRLYSSDGAIAVGAPCSDAIKLTEGALTFLQVSPGHVAVCSTN